MFATPAPMPDANASVDSAPVHAFRNSPGVINDVYSYAGSTTFPTSTYNGENYWVDVVFTPSQAPGQPTNVVATASNASAGVTWNAPASGGAVTSYVITPYIGSTGQPTTTVSGSPAPTSAIVTGLTNGTAYTFTVTASNATNGPPSAASNSVTPSVGAPAVPNGGFESGMTYWTAGGVVPPVASTVKSHSGTGSALLGVGSGPEPLGDSWLSHTVAVRAGSSTLTFWYWPSTADGLCTGSGCIWDWEEAEIRSTSGATLASIFRANSNAQAWTQVSFNMTPYAGQTVVLWFNVHLDGANPPDDTFVYLDDISVN
jgi:hypothetical protein